MYCKNAEWSLHINSHIVAQVGFSTKKIQREKLEIEKVSFKILIDKVNKIFIFIKCIFHHGKGLPELFQIQTCQ